MTPMKLEIEGLMDGHSGGSGEEGSSEGKAPSNFLAECLSASLRRRYGTALRYCRLILRHEPQHRAAKALLPTLQTRAAAALANITLDEDAAAGNVGDSSASATDSSYSAGGAERSESRCSDQSHSESRSENAASDSVSELDLESELEDEPLEDLDTYTSNSASISHEVSDSSAGSGGGGAECDDNGNCTASDVRNDNATLPLSHPHGNWPHDTHLIALDNDLRSIKDNQLRKSCAH